MSFSSRPTMPDQQPPIMPRRSPGVPWVAVAVLFAVGVVSVVLAVSMLRGQATQSPNTAGVDAAQVAPSETPTATPTPTVNPDILARDAAMRGAAEAQATGEWLQVTIVAGRATDDEARRRDTYQMDVQRTQAAVETDVVRTSEAVSVTNRIMLSAVTATASAAIMRGNLDAGGKITLYATVFLAVLIGGSVIAYIVVSAWRLAGQPQQAPNENYNPSSIMIHDGNSLQFPVPTRREYTDDELLKVAWVATNGDGLTFRSLEDYGISSERWKVIREPMIKRGMLRVKRETATGIEVEPTPKGAATFAQIVSNSPTEPVKRAKNGTI